MADAQDLKSWDLKKSCGFESHHRHHFNKKKQNEDVCKFVGPTRTLPVATLLFDTGFDPKAALVDILIIGVAADVLFVIWPSVVFVRKARI